MAKISIDMQFGPNGKYLVSQKVLHRVMSACQVILQKLGPLAETVTVIKIAFPSKEGARTPGVDIWVYFKDPLGKECSHSIAPSVFGYSVPSTEAIVEKVLHWLPSNIKDHLKKAIPLVEAAQARLTELTDSST